MIRPSTTVTHSPGRDYDRGDDWTTASACLPPLDPEKWYPDTHNGYSDAEAKAICRTCPVKATCLQDALDTHDWHGIRGGLDGDQRKRLHRNAARKSQAKETNA